MDEVVNEAFEIAVRRSGPRGRWLPPVEADESADLGVLAEAARERVLDRLQARINEARRVLDLIDLHDVPATALPHAGPDMMPTSGAAD
jgi:hypothetical protein